MDKPNTKEDFSSPLSFPCDFIIKIMGKSNQDFENEMLILVQKHYPTTTADNITSRASEKNNYVALTISVHANNKQELDALYEELSQCPAVLMAL